MALTRITKGVIKPNENYDTHNINSTGIVTATKFVGPFDNINVSGAATFTGNVTIGGTLTYEDVTNIDSVGLITARNDIHVGAGVSAVGVGTFGSLDIGGDIDVDGHTNLDNVSIAGVTTFSEDITLNGANFDITYDRSLNTVNFDQSFLKFGTSGNMSIRNSNIEGLTNIKAPGLYIRNMSNAQMITCYTGGRIELYHNNSKKLDTTSTGIDVTGTVVADGADVDGDLDVDGHTNLDNVSVAGVTTFSGNVNITNTNPKLFFYDTNNDSDYAIVNNGGVFRINDETNSLNRFSIDSNGNVSILKDLDVDGHTELDNVRIAGIVTATSLTVAGNQILGHGNSTGNQIKFTRSGLGDELVIGTDGYGNSTQYEATIQSSIVTARPLVFATNNTERLRIAGDGKILLAGANNYHADADDLVLKERSGGNVGMTFQNTGTGFGVIYFADSGAQHSGRIQYDHSNNSLDIFTNGTESLMIDSDGRLQIGASNNTGSYTKLVVGAGNNINTTAIINTGDVDTDALTLSNWDGSTTTNKVMMHFDCSGIGGYNIGMPAATDAFVIEDDGGAEGLRIQSGVVNIGDTVATSQNDRLLQIGKTNRGATYLELRTSTSGVGGIVLSDGTGSGNEGYRGTLEYVHSSDYMLFKTAATERLRINNEGAISVQSVLTGNTALAYLKNGRTRASGNKYGIEFRDNINEANANIVIRQNSSGNNAAHMDFYINGGTGGNGLENGNHTLRLQQSGDIVIPTGNLNFRTLSSSPAQAAPASINMGGTHSNAAGNGTNLNAKLKVWSDGTDMMGLSVSSNQLDYIVTQEVYDHVWYGGNSGTSELMRLEGDGDLILTNGNKLNINAASAAGQGGALINIGWDGGNNIATKAIDIGGGWSAGENKRITFSHSTGSNNLVGEINSVHYGGTPSRTNPHSGLRFGKLYHSNDSTTFTMTLDSTSTTTADLNLKGAYRSTKHPAFSVSSYNNSSNLGSLTKLNYAISGTGVANNDGYDATNNRFVAPVDGFYHFYARHWFTPGYTGTAWLYFFRNGSQVKECRLSLGASAGEYNTMQLSTTLYLSATNYIEVYAQGSGSQQFHPSGGSFHTEFSGFLVC